MLPYLKTESASMRKIDTFTGLNRTEAASDGNLTDSLNLSSSHYPCLAVRKGRRDAMSTTRGSALYAWDELVTVDGTTLLYAGESVGTVSEGKKQFAVVNSKLVIWPDKLILDLQTKALKKMEATIAAAANTASFTKDTLTLSSTDPVLATQTESFAYDSDSPQITQKYTSVDWVDGAWTKAGETEISVASLVKGDILIPSAGDAMRIKNNEEYAAENAEGHYLKVKSVSQTGVTECKWERWNSALNSGTQQWWKETWETTYSGTWADSDVSGSYYSDYRFNTATGKFTLIGPLVSIGPGSTQTGYIGDGFSITCVSSSGASYTQSRGKSTAYYEDYYYYTKGSTKIGDVYADKGTYPNNERASDGYWYVLVGETGFEGTVSVTYEVYGVGNPKLTSRFQEGDRITLSGCTTQPANNIVRAKVVEVGDYTMKFDREVFTAATETGAITISREVPDLDFICASNNRLWGVCNNDVSTMYDAETQTYKEVTARTIWASALGLPERFYDYDGLSTDSYAVAVGSPGDFTGIIDYSGAVLCWKEDLLHRMAGDYPANYVMYTDYYNGLQAGSEKSMVIINEVLYYKGRDGVYAFSGGQPQLISYRLGEERYEAAVAGERAGRYYISMRNASNVSELLSYDTIRDCWYAEDGLDVTDFAELRGTLYALTSNGMVYAIGESDNADVEWSATLAEWHEGVYEYKQYRRIHIDADIAKGAVLEVYVTVDDTRERLAWRMSKSGRQRIDVPLRNIRAKRVIVRLAGKGDVVIRRITRDVALRG